MPPPLAARVGSPSQKKVGGIKGIEEWERSLLDLEKNPRAASRGAQGKKKHEGKKT